MSVTGFQRRRRMLEEAQAEQAVENVAAPEQPKTPEPPAQPPANTGPVLADMTVNELRALATEKGITLGRELRKKSDIVDAMEKALGKP